MAMTLNAGDYGRSEIFEIDPEQIIAECNDARGSAHTPEVVEAMAAKIELDGQLVPALAVRVEDNRVRLFDGFCRHAAVCLLNERNAQKRRLSVRVFKDINAEEAFRRSVSAGVDRSEFTQLDIAHQQRKFRQDFSWSDDKIAEFYKCSVASVVNLSKVMTLSGPLREKVASGDMPVATAVQVASLPEPVREQVVAKATDTNGHVDGTVVKRAVRERAIDAGGKGPGRTLKEIKEFFATVEEDNKSEAVRELASKLLAFTEGKITDKQMTNAFGKCAGKE